MWRKCPFRLAVIVLVWMLDPNVAQGMSTMAEEEVEDVSYNNNNKNSNNNNNERCRWGSAECHNHISSSENSTGNDAIPFLKTTTTTSTVNTNTNINMNTATSTEVATASSLLEVKHEPPEGMQLVAHVVTKQDGLSYFLDSHPKTIPYLECGAIGSTTSPVALKHVTFRHFPNGAEPNEWSTVTVPTLCIPLTPMEIQTSGGESRIFEAGSVILLDDTMGKGHKLKSAHHKNNNHQDLMAAMLSLPHHHYHHYYYHEEDNIHHQADATTSTSAATTESPYDNYFSRLFGKKHSSHPQDDLFTSNQKTPFWRKHKHNNHNNHHNNNNNNHHRQRKPCQLEQDPNYTSSLIHHRHSKNDDLSIMVGNDQYIVSKRRLILSAIGMTLSTSLAYFLSKVAPLQLAVGIGGACIIGGGTACVVQGGEYLIEELNLWLDERHVVSQQQQQLQQQTHLQEEEEEEDQPQDEDESPIRITTNDQDDDDVTIHLDNDNDDDNDPTSTIPMEPLMTGS